MLETRKVDSVQDTQSQSVFRKSTFIRYVTDKLYLENIPEVQVVVQFNHIR